MTVQKTTGRCLCGAVSVSATVGTNAGACHCDLCRTWGGGPLFALDCTDVRFEGEARISLYASTPRAERGFCQVCGTHIFIRVKSTGRYIMPAGLFDAEPELRFDHQIFIDRKPDYYTFADDTERWTGEDLFAQAKPTSS